MDLVEIRKKAKLKKTKPSVKKAALETTLDDDLVKDMGEKLLSSPEMSPGSASEPGKGKVPDEAVLPEPGAIGGGESSFVGAQEDAFLSNIMDALSLNDFEEVAD